MKHSIIICTRNRPDELGVTLDSVAGQSFSESFSVTIVDGSDEQAARAIADLCSSVQHPTVNYFKYPTKPSLARQRNYGIALLPDDIDVVHFMDDDVTLDREYLQNMDEAFLQNDNAMGIGATVIEEGRSLNPPNLSWVMRSFLLYSDQPGRVLASGHETPAQSSMLSAPTSVEWLNGCAAYRRQVFDDFRFADILEGYSLDEDLDFSYRVGREHCLLVYPAASMIHRRSSDNRLPGRQYFEDYLIHRYWFVRNNLPAVTGRVAFWWSAMGRMLRAQLGRTDGRSDMLKGYAGGVRKILRRDHYLFADDE